MQEYKNKSEDELCPGRIRGIEGKIVRVAISMGNREVIKVVQREYFPENMPLKAGTSFIYNILKDTYNTPRNS